MDMAQWEYFVQQFGPVVRGTVARALRSYRARPANEEIDELAQEVYFRLLTRHERGLRFRLGRHPGELGSYVARVARAAVVDALRTAAAEKRGARALLSLPNDALARSALADPRYTPERRLMVKDCMRLLALGCRAAGLTRQPAGRRRNLRILYLAFFAGLTSREIVRATGAALAPSTVDTVVYRARRHLALRGVTVPHRSRRPPRL
jgi:DNA-directed RNA polymerase specialized sigma24 family protein